jgi:hypothetical protein
VYAPFYRHGLQQSVYQAMQSIVTQLLNERVTQPLVDVILHNLIKQDKVHYYIIYYLSFSLVEGVFFETISSLQSRQILRYYLQSK